MKHFYVCLTALFIWQCGLAQSEKSFDFINFKPKWVHISKHPAISDSVRVSGPSGPLFLFDKDLYIGHNLTKSFFQGHLIEKVNPTNGETIWQNYYSNPAKYERKFASSIKLRNNQLEIYNYKEAILSPVFWLKSNLNIDKYCIDDGQLCGSVITDRTDKQNKILLASSIYTYVSNSYLTHDDSTAIYIEMRADTTTNKYNTNFKRYRLNPQGHQIDSVYSEIKTKYNVVESSLNEYKNNHHFAFVYAANNVAAEHKVVYYDEKFNVEKEYNITAQLPQYCYRYAMEYFDDKHFIIKSWRYVIVINDVKILDIFSLFDHNGNKKEEIFMTGFEKTDDDVDYSKCTILYPSNRLLIATMEAKNPRLSFFTANSTGSILPLSSIALSKKVTFNAIKPMLDNEFICNFFCLDESSNYLNKPLSSTWALFSPASIGFTTSTKDATLNSFTFYPNPTNSQLIINTDESYDAIRLYSIEGKLMQHHPAQQSNTLDVSALPSGMYFFELLEGSKAVTRKEKFVKM